ncbi:type VI secretion system baseplate subunit TssE [Ochrobactrum sp. GPK 3]|uniref:type VI secretion system baseplate subunit TssE n=1 Tax=Brucella sp. 22210 TaxID=3453892 RepID=UPI003138519F
MIKDISADMVESEKTVDGPNFVIASSVLDRLIDTDPGCLVDNPSSKTKQLQKLHDSIQRDLQALLNTRRPVTRPPKHLEELENSILYYGTEVFASTELESESVQLALLSMLECCIAKADGRLSNVRVTVMNGGFLNEQNLELRIEANVRLQEGMPSFCFEVTVDPASHHFILEPENE